MRGPDGKIVTIAMAINCDEYRTETGEDGIIKHIERASRTVKAECKTCSLVNAIRLQRQSTDPKDRAVTETD